MGREVKRVPLDFKWPLNKVWSGYLRLSCIESCDDCRESAKLSGLKFTDYNCPIIEELDPPNGIGWQMWETTSEGSPISPVCNSKEELAQWLEENKASSFGRMTATYDQWLSMIDDGYSPSAIIDEKGFRSGVEASADKE